MGGNRLIELAGERHGVGPEKTPLLANPVPPLAPLLRSEKTNVPKFNSLGGGKLTHRLHFFDGLLGRPQPAVKLQDGALQCTSLSGQQPPSVRRDGKRSCRALVSRPKTPYPVRRRDPFAGRYFPEIHFFGRSHDQERSVRRE